MKCEVTHRSHPVNSNSGGHNVVGFDVGNHKIVKPVSSSSRYQQTSFNIVNPGIANDLMKPKIILGLRRSPIRDSSSGLIYSDYDDTDVNPNIIVNYLNR